MITLCRKENDETAEEIHQKLKDLVIAFEVEILPGSASHHVIIKDSGEEIKTAEDINNWLITLENELAYQRSLSGDACFIDPKTGNVC